MYGNGSSHIAQMIETKIVASPYEDISKRSGI
jgi:hypothetical protein